MRLLTGVAARAVADLLLGDADLRDLVTRLLRALRELVAEQIGVAPRAAAPSGSPYGEGDIPLRGEDERMSTFFIVMAFLLSVQKIKCFRHAAIIPFSGRPPRPSIFENLRKHQ